MDVSGYWSVNGNWYVYKTWEIEQERKNDLNCAECKRLFALTNWANIESHMREVHVPKRKKKWAFTFTTNLDTKLEVQKEMCYSAWKLFLQKTTPVEEGKVYLEYTEEGRPHLHGWYATEHGGRVFAKTIRRCWPTWGEKARQKHFVGGYHEEMKTDRYEEYSSAEGRLVVSKKKDADARYHGDMADVWWLDRGKGYFAENPPE